MFSLLYYRGSIWRVEARSNSAQVARAEQREVVDVVVLSPPLPLQTDIEGAVTGAHQAVEVGLKRASTLPGL